jgi:hypothetical protein
MEEKEGEKREKLDLKQRWEKNLEIISNSKFLQEVVERNKRDYISIIIVVGGLGIGKSLYAVKLGEILDPSFGINNICFGVEEAINAFDAFPRGSCVILDEAGVEAHARDWQTRINKVLGYATMILRQRGINFILCLPRFSFLDKNIRLLGNFLVEMQDRGVGKVFRISDDPRAIESIKRDDKPIEVLKLELPSLDLVREYEAKKESYVKSSMKEFLRELKQGKRKE